MTLTLGKQLTTVRAQKGKKPNTLKKKRQCPSQSIPYKDNSYTRERLKGQKEKKYIMCQEHSMANPQWGQIY